jgi:hypothetical protein
VFTIAQSRAALRRQEQTRTRRDSVGIEPRGEPLTPRQRAELVELLPRLTAAGFSVAEERAQHRWRVQRGSQTDFIYGMNDMVRVLDRAAAGAARPAREGLTATAAECTSELRRVGYDVVAQLGGRFVLLKNGMGVRTLTLQELRTHAFPGPSR